MQDQAKLDVIMPCYNSHKTIERAIASVAMQTIVSDVKLTIVNDAGNDYSEIIEKYKDRIDIQELRYEENHGPGYARNYGLNHTDRELVTFIDSDDSYANPYSLAILRKELLAGTYRVMCISDFVEETGSLLVKLHKKDTSFMHGKMYKRSFLQKHEIQFNTDRFYNEDVGFNILAQLVRNPAVEQVVFIDFLSYYWLCNRESIVRHDKSNFDYGKSFIGFAENLLFVFKELEKRGLDTERILFERVTSTMRLYLLYTEYKEKRPDLAPDNFKQLTRFYKHIYEPVKAKVTDQILSKVYANLPFKGNKTRNLKAFKQCLADLQLAS